MKTNNWQEIYLTMRVGETRYIITSSRGYASVQLNFWRKRHPDNARWFGIEPAFCGRDGMEGMIITRLLEPSKEQRAAQRAQETRARKQREAVTA